VCESNLFGKRRAFDNPDGCPGLFSPIDGDAYHFSNEGLIAVTWTKRMNFDCIVLFEFRVSSSDG